MNPGQLSDLGQYSNKPNFVVPVNLKSTLGLIFYQNLNCYHRMVSL